ncbi:kinase [Trichoderma arundinaceum]|uniref:Kinase n=1 Tax=Trichoderma arundinaceum TaxID=490622 RepID=A0A395P2M0_TRIAR|nr:kinase [Trichoderma arundinaceum]
MATAISPTKYSDSEADAANKSYPTTLLSSMYSYAHRSLDYIIPPSTRQSAYDATSTFASNQPILFSFTAFQVLFSLLPILLFLSFALSTFLLALFAAFIFALFWIGVASLFLVPTLFITSSLALLCWGSSVGSFVVVRWLYHHAPAGVFPGSSDTSSPRIEVTSDGAWRDVKIKQEDHFDDVKSLE